jgi:outer membrane protein OmpA-like peptidoglycan-associated protein
MLGASMTTVDFAPGLTLPIGTPSVVKLPPRVFRARMTGFLFDTDKTFLLPLAMDRIRRLRELCDAHPGAEVLVTGHTDTVDTPAHNLELSCERADSIAAFLRDQVDVWMKWYAGTSHSKKWSTLEDQHMLATVTDGTAPFYAGPVHGVDDEATRAAALRFQQHRNATAGAGLTADGLLGPLTRRELVVAYMATDGTTLSADTHVETHGCGESHLAHPTDDEVNEPRNRRVEVFVFEGAITPKPRTPCADCPEYPQWVAASIETIDLDKDAGGGLDLVVPLERDLVHDPDSTAEVRLQCTAGASYDRVLAAGQPDVTRSGETPLFLYRFRSVPPGLYRVWTKVGESWRCMLHDLQVTSTDAFSAGAPAASDEDGSHLGEPDPFSGDAETYETAEAARGCRF